MAGEDNNLDNSTSADKTAMTGKTPGERLRAERERRGLSLIQVAGEMHMDVRVAQALEEDDYSPLGAPIFVKGHLRNYAKLLGLPADELINDYAQASAPQTPELMTNRPTVGSMDQVGGNGAGWFAGIGVFLIIVLLGCLAWWFYSQQNGAEITLPSLTQSTEPTDDNASLFNNNTERVDPLFPDNEQAQLSDGINAENNLTAPSEEITDARTMSEQTASEQAPQSAAPDMSTDAADSANKESESVTKTPVEPEPVTLELTFNDDSWVEVYGADDRPLLYELGRAGQVRQLQVELPARIFLGNAPVVNVSVNGVPFEISGYLQADSTARFTIKDPANGQTNDY